MAKQAYVPHPNEPTLPELDKIRDELVASDSFDDPLKAKKLKAINAQIKRHS